MSNIRNIRNTRRRRDDATREFWFAVGRRLIDAGFASAASMTVRAVLASTLGAAIADLAIGILAVGVFTAAAYVAFNRARD